MVNIKIRKAVAKKLDRTVEIDRKPGNFHAGSACMGNGLKAFGYHSKSGHLRQKVIDII